jgi:hypothetical protein
MRKIRKKFSLFFIILLLLIISGLLFYFLKDKPSADAINSVRPLPYMVHWNATHVPEMIGMAERGHSVVPTFPSDSHPTWDNYSPKDLLKIKQLDLPIDMIGGQWESKLYTDSQYTDIDRDTTSDVFTGSDPLTSENPNNIFTDNTFTKDGIRRLDPIGPEGQIEKWREVGRYYAGFKSFKFLQEIYPNPSSVILAGNNEARVVFGTSAADLSKRFNELYPNIKTQIPNAFDRANFGNRVVGDGWIDRYGAMFQAWRDNIVSPSWKNLKFTSYLGYLNLSFRAIYTATWGTGASTFTSYEGDLLPDSDNTVPRLCYNFYVWDGSSPEIYLNFDGGDTHLYGPQFGSMNWVFAEEDAKRVNPDHYLEFSVWDGGSYAVNNGISPQRYAADIQYSAWIARPQAIREFRGASTWEEYLPQFLELTKITDRVHRNSVLRDFWQSGELVENPVGHHPYQNMVMANGFSDSEIKTKYGVGRWFYLFSDLDTPNRIDQDNDGDLDGFRDYDYANRAVTNVEIPVYSLALTKGEAPNRQWLVYTYSPTQDRTGVTITVPDFGDINVNSQIAGNFYLLDESSRSVTPISDEEAHLENLILNNKEPVIAPGGQFQISIVGAKDQYDYDFEIPTNLVWSATGGVIDQNGLYTAGDMSGDYQITIQSGEFIQNIPVKIKTLMSHWKFDENVGSYVSDSANESFGCYNYRNWDSDGKFGSAGSFDGNWYGVSCDANEQVLAPEEFTISAWFKKTPGGGGGYIFNASNANDSLGYYLKIDQNATTGILSVAFLGKWANLPIQEGEWHHIVAEYKPGQYAKLYLDGSALWQISNVPSEIIQGSDRVQIGKQLIGSVDQVRFYNQALSTDDVLNLYNESSNIPQISLPDSAITYPNRQLAIDASVTNANAFSWTKVSGPGSIVFGAPSSANTTFITDVAGSYTLRLEASNGTNSATRDIVVNVYKLADINNDGSVNEIDFTLLLFNWGSIPINRMSDINGDNITDVNDFTLLLFWWGR